MTKKEINVSLKTMAIKARVLNQFRTEFFNKRLENFTEDQKLEYFNKFFSSVKEAHSELNAYKSKRKRKAKIEKLREEKKNLVESE